MYRVFLPLCLLVWATGALELPPEPRFPSTVCVELVATLFEGPVGHLRASDETKLDTRLIQGALDGCPRGEAVKLVKREDGANAFLSGPLNLPTGVTLWIDEGVTLFGSRDPRHFDRRQGSCGVLSDNSQGCLPLIGVRNGKDNAIVGDGVIDGRGGQKMIGTDETWWELSLRAEAEVSNQSCPRLIEVEKSLDFVLYRIRLHNSPFWHFFTEDVHNMIIWGVKVDTPSVAYPVHTHARNTDGLDPNGQNIVITQCYINAGDDAIAIKGQRYPVANVLIQDNHFYNSHGMSIGSEINEGAVNVTVRNLSIVQAENGLRIKSDASKGGHVRSIVYENVCIKDTDIPLIFDTYYTNKDDGKIPNFHDIHVKNVRIISSRNKTAVFRGYNKRTPLKIQLDNVVSDIELGDLIASNAEITLGPGQVSGIPMEVSLEKNVIIYGKSGKSVPIDCSNAFVPFPR